MRDLVVTRSFMKEGGSELAPMSTTADLEVALEYTRAEQGSRSGAALLFRVLVGNMMQRGADLAYLSVTPGEKECAALPLVERSLRSRGPLLSLSPASAQVPLPAADLPEADRSAADCGDRYVEVHRRRGDAADGCTSHA